MAYHAYRIYPTATPSITLRQMVCMDTEISGQLAAGESYEQVDFGQSSPESPTQPEYAPTNSPTFTGIPTVPTATPGTDTAQAASTAFVRSEISALVDASPSTLDTLNELAAALGDDQNFATTVTNALADKAPLVSPTFSGTPTVPTATPGTASTQAASTAFVDAAIQAIEIVRGRQTAQIVTATLTPDQEFTGTVVIGKSYLLLKVVASSDCRIRLYETEGARTADLDRPITVDYEAGQGVVCDLYPEGTSLTIILSPRVEGGNQETVTSVNIPYAIQNKGLASAAITITFHYIAWE